MPNRPPKKWWDQAVRSIAANPEVVDPERLAGWVWAQWMSPQAKAQAMKGEYDPRPIEQALRLLPRKQMIRYGLLDPQFKTGFKRGFKESVYHRYPHLRPKQASIYPEVHGSGLKAALYPPEQKTLTPRERATYRGYRGRPALSRTTATFSRIPTMQFKPFSKSMSTIRRQSKQKFGKPFNPYGTETDREEKEYGEYQRYRQAGYDPDHLGDLINPQEQLVEQSAELLEEMKERDRWIDQEYGPLSEEYGEMAERGEYDVKKKRKIKREWLPHRLSAQEQADLMSLVEFQKRWQDPNQRPQLKKLKAVYDPKLRRVIQLHYNLKAHDPGKYPDPIDIHGYADKHAGVMLRLVPEIHGLAPKDLENMNPYRPGYVMISPKGSLVEIQAKYPQHQWDNDIMPRMIQDPTNEIDLRHGRIVRRGKANIATNIFIDRDNS